MAKPNMEARQALEFSEQAKQHRQDLTRQRAELEAALLAYRCGWRANDEVRVERLRRGLKAVLDALGAANDPARALLEP
ncbi:MAG: hypothetical protein AAGE43_21380 [Pseudomonadota bacterium]